MELHPARHLPPGEDRRHHADGRSQIVDGFDVGDEVVA
jgi:hypothetical protein